MLNIKAQRLNTQPLFNIKNVIKTCTWHVSGLPGKTINKIESKKL